jgi:hypothetical protein
MAASPRVTGTARTPRARRGWLKVGPRHSKITRQNITAFSRSLLQPLNERDNARLSFRIVRGQIHQHTGPPHPLALLRARRERPHSCRDAEQRDEIAPSHA